MVARRVEPSVHKAVVAEMDPDNFADQHPLRPDQVDQLHHPAFQRRRGIGHARAVDGEAFRFRHPCRRELVRSARETGGGRVHHLQCASATMFTAKTPLSIALIMLSR
jgi:hypothetical protein